MTISTAGARSVALTRGATYRVHVDIRGVSGRSLDAVRLLLTADVVRRVIEDHCGGQAWLAVVSNPDGADSLLRGWARGMGVREAAAWVTSPERARLVLTGPPDLVIHPSDEPVVDVTGATMPVAPVRPAFGIRPGDYEPTTTRLALLRFRRQDPARLSTARLHRAQETLQRWRSKVADWADMPAAPACARQLDAVHAALASDFDTATALKVLHRLETDLAVQSGSKFETFMYADRVLALDLSHLVGRLRR